MLTLHANNLSATYPNVDIVQGLYLCHECNWCMNIFSIETWRTNCALLWPTVEWQHCSCCALKMTVEILQFDNVIWLTTMPNRSKKNASSVVIGCIHCHNDSELLCTRWPDVLVELRSSNLRYYKISLPLTDNKSFLMWNCNRSI